MRKRLAVAMDGITPQERKEAINALLAEWLDFEKEDLYGIVKLICRLSSLPLA
jgi:hypothetical protein